MNAVSVADAKLNLEKLLESVVANVEPLIIVGDSGDQTVLVSLEEFNFWQQRSSGIEARRKNRKSK